VFSVAIWGFGLGAVALGDVLACWLYGVPPPVSSSRLSDMEKMYGSLLWLYVGMLSVVAGLITAFWDIHKAHERIFNPLRMKLEQNTESLDDVWTRFVVSKEDALFRIKYSDGRDVWGVGMTASNRDEDRALWVINKTEKMDEKRIQSLPAPEGTLIDLRNGYTLDVYDANKIQESWHTPDQTGCA